MRELRPGVWHWQSPHPDWNEDQWWPELVSSYAIELGDDVVLFDESFAFPDSRERWLYTGVTRAAKKLTVVV